ncbi:MAG: PAS domain S-box protein, partial [Candidatus Hydrogenedentota bacterium]
MSQEEPTTDEQRDSLIWAWGLVESAVEGIVTIDERGVIEYMNPAACAQFGYKKEEVLGQNIRILMPNPYSDQHDSYLQNYISTGVQKVIGIGREVVGLRKNKSTFPMHLSIS